MKTGWWSAEPSIRMQAWGLALLRVGVGVTFLMHGWQKMVEIGIPGVAGFFGELGVPAPMVAATVVSFLELVGGSAVIVGLFARWIAIPLAIDALSAALLFHLPQGFFADAGGYELVLLLALAAITLGLAGPGAFALERAIVRARPTEGPDERRTVAGAE